MNRPLLIVLFVTLAMSAAAQSKPASAETQATPRVPRSRTITGRVLDQNNAPLEDATVVALPAGLTGMQQSATTAAKIRPTSTDEQGRFTLDNLPPGSYMLYPDLAGYVAVPDDNEGREQKYYRPGDTVTIHLVKGGVITGTVTQMTGEPIINIKVNAIRLRDLKGRAASQTSLDLQREFRTDDRGVYRIYGLLPGTYLILAGGRSILQLQAGAYDSDAPTYHPSSTRDTASEIVVHSGEEMAGIDIRYRDYTGHAVSGTLSSAGNATTNPAMNIGVVTMSDAATRAFMGMAMAMLSPSGQGFQFDGVADGEYIVAATAADASAGSTPRRITVKGGDVTGIELAVAPYASIAGRVTLESAPTAERKADCQPRRAAAIEETILLARAADRTGEPSIKPLSLMPLPADSAPNNKGEFKIGHLDAGRHRVVIRFPGEDWYARSLKLPPVPPATEARDAALDGIAVKAGEQVQGLTVTLAEGAAALRGRVIPATEGAPLPDHLRLHLVPAEKEAEGDLLRYYEAELRGDSFELLNLAPGRYFVIARRAAEEGTSDDSPRPVAWDTEARKRLRQRAEFAAATIELRPCQRVADYIFKYATAAKKKAEAGTQ